MIENQKNREKTEVPLILPLLLFHEPAASRPEDQTNQLRNLTLSGGGAWWLEASGVDRRSGRAPQVQPSAAGPSSYTQLGVVAGPSGAARHGAMPERVGRG
jgi:hypothetical protein